MDEKTRKVLEECEKFIDESTPEELAAYEKSLNITYEMYEASETEEEYVIHIGMTPHLWDNKDEPYWWSIIRNDCNEGFGWSKTSEQAWKDANKYHEKYHRQ